MRQPEPVHLAGELADCRRDCTAQTGVSASALAINANEGTKPRNQPCMTGVQGNRIDLSYGCTDPALADDSSPGDMASVAPSLHRPRPCRRRVLRSAAGPFLSSHAKDPGGGLRAATAPP